jgi:PLP dependent protein
MIAENIKLLREEIARKCAEINRNSSEIKLIAVSKNFSPKEINEALREGLKDFGENRAQELNSKFDVLGNNVTWHFIGHLQKNKVKYVVKSAEYIHSVDSLELAAEINRRAEKLNKVQKILLEIKTSFEETKSGIEGEKEIVEIVKYCNGAPNINLIGLMTIAPFVEDMNVIRNSFITLRRLRDKLNSLGYKNVHELSMGMTSDYKIAIEEGATMLRIGSAIFGQRNYSLEWRN